LNVVDRGLQDQEWKDLLVFSVEGQDIRKIFLVLEEGIGAEGTKNLKSSSPNESETIVLAFESVF